jgi:hypothetical protein
VTVTVSLLNGAQVPVASDELKISADVAAFSPGKSRNITSKQVTILPYKLLKLTDIINPLETV